MLHSRRWMLLRTEHFLWGIAWSIVGLVLTFLYSATAFWIADKVDFYPLAVLLWWSGWVLLFTALAWAMDNL